MEKAWADAVTSPSFIGGIRMVSEMMQPAVVSFLDMMLRDREEILRFKEIAIKKEAPLTGKDTGAFKALNKTGATAGGRKRRPYRRVSFQSPEKSKIRENDTLVTIGSPAML
jgi:voltage-gated potassium channel